MIECGLLRDPGRDYDDVAVWLAVPLQSFPPAARSGRLEIDRLPVRTAVDLYVTRP